MATWTDELKARVIELYEEGEPTPENSVELIKEIAEEVGQTANGVRQVLIQAKVYVKKEPGTSSAGKEDKESKTTGAKRVGKDVQIAALRKAIEDKGAEVDEDILAKLTGKAAAYFTTVLTK